MLDMAKMEVNSELVDSIVFPVDSVASTWYYAAMSKLPLFPLSFGKNPGPNLGSAFRYPGGKKNFVSSVRGWLKAGLRPSVFVEPFAGSAVVSMAVAREDLADRIVLNDLDPVVSNFWQVLADGGSEELCRMLLGFRVTRQNVREVWDRRGLSGIDLAFQTIVKNRTSHNGIVGKGMAGMIGEIGRDNKGIMSCWTIRTFVPRILEAGRFFASGKASFKQRDAIEVIREYAGNPSAALFVDPPYFGKGSILYSTHGVSPSAVLEAVSGATGRKMVTYDMVPEIVDKAVELGMATYRFPMLSAGGNSGGGFKDELVIVGDRPEDLLRASKLMAKETPDKNVSYEDFNDPKMVAKSFITLLLLADDEWEEKWLEAVDSDDWQAINEMIGKAARGMSPATKQRNMDMLTDAIRQRQE